MISFPDSDDVPAGALRYAVDHDQARRHLITYCRAAWPTTWLGGLCYTGITTSPGFENALYRVGYQPGPLVHGHPSVVSTVGGGNATLAWEPQPGLVAYVGYSGPALANEQIDALTRLAATSNVISPAEWTASHPQVVSQTNDW